MSVFLVLGEQNSLREGDGDKKRLKTSVMHIAYFDTLRVIAILLVIVNHTVGLWMTSLHSQTLNWWIAAGAFFSCKIAVPLFVMISGALLLPKKDSYSKNNRRIARMARALIVFSILYYLASNTDWSIPDFLDKFWHCRVDGRAHLWYLYMYIGLLAMMPLLQRMVEGMDRKDCLYFLAISFGVVNLIPMLVQFNSALAITTYFDLPLFSGYLGLLVFGHYLANVIQQPTRKVKICAVVMFLICLLFLLIATDYFYDSGAGKNYLRLDNRVLNSRI